MILPNISQPINANAHRSSLRIGESEPVSMIAASRESERRRRKFHMVAYNGGPMRIIGWDLPVVVDLRGVKPLREKIPVLREHDFNRVIGHATLIENDGRSLKISGVVSGANEHAREVVDSSLDGFEWNASVGLEVKRATRLPQGQRATVNGREFTGPVYIAEESVLNEASFVANGADHTTRIAVAQRKSSAQRQGSSTVPFPKRINDSSRSTGGIAVGNDAIDVGDVDTAQAVIERTERFDRMIEASRLHHLNPDDRTSQQIRTIRASVIRGDTSLDDATDSILEIVSDIAGRSERQRLLDETRNGRTQPFRLSASAQDRDEGDLPRRVAASANLEEGEDPIIGSLLLRAMGAETAAVERYGNRAVQASRQVASITPSIYDAARYFAESNGQDPRRIEASGFSTLSGFSEALHRATVIVMRQGWEPMVAPVVAMTRGRIVSLSDYFEHNMLDTEDNKGFEEVPLGGEVKHRVLDIGGRKISMRTWAELFSIDERMIRGNAGQVIGEAAMNMRYRAAQTVLREWFTLIMKNTGAFFSAGNKNLMTGGESVLGIDSFSKAVAMMRAQVDKAGEPVGAVPGFLVVPPELEQYARQLMESIELTADVGQNGSSNPWRGTAEVVVEPRLSSPKYPNNSARAWYLIAKPESVPPFVLGAEGGSFPAPRTEEERDKSLNTFAHKWRARIDFGVAQNDYRGAVKSAGE
jgi:hypothetical protein